MRTLRSRTRSKGPPRSGKGSRTRLTRRSSMRRSSSRSSAQPPGARRELRGGGEGDRLLAGDRRQRDPPLLVELAAFQGAAVSAELPAQLLRAPRHELAQVDELAGREDDARDRLDEGGEPF